MTTFPKGYADTVKKLAEALLERAYNYDVQTGRNAYNECGFCGSHVYWDKDVETIVHKEDCVVSFAKLLME